MKSLQEKISSMTKRSVLLSSGVIFLVAVILIQILTSRFSSLYTTRADALVAQLESSAKEHQQNLADRMEKAIKDKALALVERDQMTLKMPFLDYSFSFIRTFLEDNFRRDPEVVHSSFVVVEGDKIQAWQFIDRLSEESGGIDPRSRYNFETFSWELREDESSELMWSQKDIRLKEVMEVRAPLIRQIDYEILGDNPRKIKAIEAVTPIYDDELGEVDELLEDGEELAFLRYVISLESIEAAIAEQETSLAARLSEIRSESERDRRELESYKQFWLIVSIALIVAITSALLLFLARKSRVEARKISDPITALTSAAVEISEGMYDHEIQIVTDDEVGVLSNAFESMRIKIKNFTEELQDLVAQRTAELKEALNEVTIEKKKVQEMLAAGYRRLDEEIDKRKSLEGEVEASNEQLIQAEKMVLLGQLLAGVAHDMASPTQLIYNSRELIDEAYNKLHERLLALFGEEADLDEESRSVRQMFIYDFEQISKGMGDIGIANRRMHDIQLAIRNQSRTDSQVDYFCLFEVVDECQVILNSKLKKFRVGNLIDKSLFMKARRSQLGQVLTNLMGNACDAMNEHGKADDHEFDLVVSAEIYSKSDKEQWVKIFVEDAGPGIPVEKRKDIFAAFYTTKPVGVGTGLGLSICSKIITAHKGTVSVGEGKLLGGASFCIDVPLELHVDQEAA